MQTKSKLDTQLDSYTQALTSYTDLNTFIASLSNEPADQSILDILYQDILKLADKASQLYISCKFSHETDSLNCFLHIHAGSGGTEAQDWVRILLNMYTKFAQSRNFKCELVDILKDDSDLIKHVTLNISKNPSISETIYNSYPYGWLKHEHGIHRFVRISPFDQNARRHTSFVAVTVTPEFNDTIDIDINPADLIIKECRSSGAGGQHVNKTNSAIQIKHVPSGIVVESQQDRCQHRNRTIAMKMLKSKLYLYEQDKLQAKHQENTMSKDDISWGNQIRSYVLHPYKLVKDLRSKYEEYDVDKVLNGSLDNFILSNMH